ncbi:MAG TPA: ferredoxin [Kineosporiaceae bacterium]|nr:ferredoxin [Kineosporiaceae bacterium]
MRSAAGNMQVAVTAAGFTALFFIIVVLVAALALGYGRRPDGSRRANNRGGRPGGAYQRPRGGRSEEPAQPARSGFQAGGKFGVSKHRDMLTVEVNPNKCARFGFCEHEAPSVFYLESDGRFGYQAVVPVAQMEEVITAMDVCPRRAIKVKIPADYDPLAMAPPPNVPDDSRRTVIPILGDRFPEDGAARPRRG